MRDERTLCLRRLRAALPLLVLVQLLGLPPDAVLAQSLSADDRFTLLDESGDLTVSWEEFSAVNNGISRQGFDQLDKSGDGVLSLDEWRVFSATHGMSVPLPSMGGVLPARDPVPPLVTPPRDPNVSGPASPSGSLTVPSAVPPSGSPAMPLILPPKTPQASVPASPSAPSPGLNGAVAPPGPQSPIPPLVTPPRAPAEGTLPMTPSQGRTEREER